MPLLQGEETPRWKQRLQNVQTFVVENYLPIAFAVALTFALAYPVPGRFLVNIVVANNVHIIQEVNMAIVFFISGLVLNTSELRKAMGRDSWPAVAFGFAMILLVTPALGFAMREIPLTPPAFSVGLTIFCLVPTTLGIGVALVRSCRGNEAIALLLTVGTNMVGVLTMPLYLKLLFLNFDTGGLRLNVNIPDLLLKLTLTILVPSVLGKLLRELSRPVESFAKQYRTPLSITSTTNLACIVWQTLSGARDLLFQQRASMIVSVIVLSAAVHVFYLVVNHFAVKFLFHPPLPEHVAVVVMASQKSAPVAVTLISYVTSLPAQQGLLAIPSVVGQLSQIFIGAALAKYIAPIVDRAVKAAKASSAAKAAAVDVAKDSELGAATTATDTAADPTAAAAAVVPEVKCTFAEASADLIWVMLGLSYS
ncbi:hypothetical protein VOLCADRAFT_99308 [Volvox carteri f. nagariensis]|uniref:Uncharacterized protein n=1 Tax=Volvox carteri f. nagariensis TaxID=3068 RepID=D8UHH2_VOLCA|nr:uncharacterized protein VOLCADRAFT_99308 [Volvox carteri f. nagariensis]EFJ40825.1 hypothetical protein VOLCADRAFT_99308 [Volvox carteri f. nagariensis]|eukprot:XP_002958094.1 hypothetical protein VOLCADRAFT_99308 [Volvox carteri f. nagariensis]